MSRLLISGLSFGYGADATTRPVLAGLDLGVADGEFLGVVGPSGCGKSTLMLLIAGLIPYATGRIQIGETVVHGPHSMAGIAFQQPSLLPWRTALDNVAWALALRGTSPRDARSQARSALAMVGLEDFADRYPAQLSGGMQQRVSLARALAVEPQVLLLDEPFASLDAQTREIMQRYLLELLTEHRRTVVFVTHQIEEALFLADRVLVLRGRAKVPITILVPFGRPRAPQVRRDPRFAELSQQVWDLLEADVLGSPEFAGWRPVKSDPGGAAQTR